MKRIVLVAFLGAAALAQDEREVSVTFEFRKERLARVAEVVTNYAGGKGWVDFSVTVDEEFRDSRVTFHLESVSVSDVLHIAARTAGAELIRVSERRFRVTAPWKASLLQKLRDQRIAEAGGSGEAVNLEQIVAQLEKAAEHEIVIDPPLDQGQKLTLQLRDLSVDEALDRITAELSCRWTPRYGVVYVASEKRLGELPARPEWDLGKAGSERIGLKANGILLSSCFENWVVVLRDVAGVDLIVPAAIEPRLESIEVTLDTGCMLELSSALALLTYPYGLTLLEKEGRLELRELR